MSGQATHEPEKVCRSCKESWPATTEFFFQDRNTQRMQLRRNRGEPEHLSDKCKACYYEQPGVMRQVAARKAGSRRLTHEA